MFNTSIFHFLKFYLEEYLIQETNATLKSLFFVTLHGPIIVAHKHREFTRKY